MRAGTTLTLESTKAIQAMITDDTLSVDLEDGRTVTIPLEWYPRLLHTTEMERNNWRVFEDSDERDIIFWESIDELIPAIALLAGVPSRESKRSFERWLQGRGRAIR